MKIFLQPTEMTYLVPFLSLCHPCLSSQSTIQPGRLQAHTYRCQAPAAPARLPVPPCYQPAAEVERPGWRAHSACSVIASVYHQPEDFYYCRWMIGLARCRPWQSKLIFRAVSSASPHCTDAKPEGGGG